MSDEDADGGCPPAEALAQLLSERATARPGDSILQHLRGCAACRRALALAGGVAEPEPLLGPGSELGRYRVLDVIGVGGMGIVYAAHDPTLDRRVALKLLLAAPDADDDELGRLQQEARAMAQLSHPNVVAVFDVGRAGSYVYLAMECVVGLSLDRWLAKAPARPQRLSVFLAAGRGLAAAHAAGIVHRDFKPANVVVGDDGRARVTDFGLAIRAAEPADTDGGLSAVAGTPRYLAPELTRGHPPTVASDVYSYCVSVIEGLTGRVPAEDDRTPISLSKNLRRVLVSGTDRDPTRRPPDLEPILRCLEAELPSGRTRGRGTWVALGIAVALAGLVGWTAMRQRDPCAKVESAFEASWDPSRREQLRTKLSAVEAEFATTTSDKVDALLDAYAEQWIAARRDACEAALVRGQQEPELMQQRWRCLDDRSRSFDALVHVLEAPTLDSLEEATTMVGRLPAIEPCDDPRYVAAEIPPPDSPDVAARVEAIRERLARIEARLDARDLEAARAEAPDALREARELAYVPLVVEALRVSGRVHAEGGHYDEALEELEEAYVEADLVSREARAHVHMTLGEVHIRNGAPARGLREFEKALVLMTDTFDAEHGSVAPCYTGMGVALQSLGRHEEALAAFRHALRIDRAYGRTADPGIWINGLNIASTSFRLGRFDEALAEARDAFEAQHASLGPDHPSLAPAHDLLGVVLGQLGAYDDALAELRRAQALRIAARGPDHIEVALSHENIGGVFLMTGDYAEALGEYRKALAIREGVLDSGHPHLAATHTNIASALWSLGDFEAAEAEYRRAQDIRRATHGPLHAETIKADVRLAVARGSSGEHDDAVAELRRALATAVEAGLPEVDVAWIHHNLGQVLYAAGEFEAAAAEHRTALRLFEKVVGTDHPRTGYSHESLAEDLAAMGSEDDAYEHHRKGFEIARRTLPPRNVDRMLAAAAVAIAAAQLGRHAEASDALRDLEAGAATRPDDDVPAALVDLAHTLTAHAEAAAPTDLRAILSSCGLFARGQQMHFRRLADAWLRERGSQCP